MMTRKANPVRLVGWAIAGGLIAASTFFLTFLPVPRFPSTGRGVWAALWAGRLQFVVWMLPFLIGVAITFWAQSQFRRGFTEDIWSEQELAPVRRLVGRPFWQWGGLLLYLAALLVMIVTPHGFRHGTVFYATVLPLQVMTQLKQLIAPSATRPESLWIERGSLQPLRSEHWGE